MSASVHSGGIDGNLRPVNRGGVTHWEPAELAVQRRIIHAEIASLRELERLEEELVELRKRRRAKANIGVWTCCQMCGCLTHTAEVCPGCRAGFRHGKAE